MLWPPALPAEELYIRLLLVQPGTTPRAMSSPDKLHSKAASASFTLCGTVLSFNTAISLGEAGLGGGGGIVGAIGSITTT